MAVTLGKNIPALRLIGQLSRDANDLGNSYERLSTGLRLNHASDDAAGLAIAARLGTSARVYTQGVRNVNDSISAFNVTDGALNQLSSILGRYLELAQQAANGSYTAAQRSVLDQEGQALQNEYNRIIGSTSFNKRKLLDASQQSITTQIGYSALQSALGTSLGKTVGSGSFSSGSSQGASVNRASIATGDYNGDGLTDNITASVSGGTLTVYTQLANGDGTFTESTTTSTGYASVKGVGLVDTDGDGKLDIVAVGTASGTGRLRVAVGINNGSGGFGALTSTTYNSVDAGQALTIDSVTFGDLTGDGKSDLLVGWHDINPTYGYVVLTGNSSAFSYSAGLESTQIGVGGGAALADMNSDGRLDLVALDGNTGNSDILLGSGTGTFGAPTVFSTLWSHFALGDFNGDGNVDIAATEGLGSTLKIFNGNGAGSASDTGQLYAGVTDGYLQSADLNGDGYLDLVATNRVLFNLGNGVFNDQGAVTASYSGATAAGATFGLADTNGDGILDIIGVQSDQRVHVQTQGTTTSTTDNTLGRLYLTTQSYARSSLSSLKSALTKVNTELGNIGSTQRRLDSAMNTLQALRLNYQSAVSQITDVDVAAETANMLSLQIKQQTATSMLAQANQQPGIALQLLREL
ncbi:MAG: FG-GAP-like repeat-containing protein [Oligoflexia bacterium]|nr:FG-GAP-like repeat-containing protein [Oligoflexia bacterium]